MNNETDRTLEKPGPDSQVETDLCHVVDLAGGVNVRQGDVLNSESMRKNLAEWGKDAWAQFYAQTFGDMEVNRDKRRHLPPGTYSMIVDEDGTVSCTLESTACPRCHKVDCDYCHDAEILKHTAREALRGVRRLCGLENGR